jgi:2-aminoadipate transaminase
VTVLEDNCYYEFAYDEPPPPTLLALDESGTVLQSDSFSKNIAPGLRMAWLVGAPETVNELVRARQDFAVSRLLARALERYVAGGHLEAHLVELRARYRQKRDRTTAALRDYCGEWLSFREPSGGFYFWLEVAGTIDWEAARRLAAAEGVELRPADQLADDVSGRRFVRLCSIQVSEEDIDRGIAILGKVLRQAAR